MSIIDNLLNKFKGQPRRMKKTVKLLRPLGFRGENFRVPPDGETEKGFHCKTPSGKGEKLFIKWGPTWNFPDGIEAYGVEGTPLTAHPTLEGVKIPVSEYLREAWGKEKIILDDGSEIEDYIYDRLPDKLRTHTENMGVICGIKATMPGEDMDLSQIETSSILRESHAANIKNYGLSTPKKNSLTDNLITIVAMALSFFVGMLAQMKGWI